VLAARTDADMVGGPPDTTMANRVTEMGVLCYRERARDNWPDHTGRSLAWPFGPCPRSGGQHLRPHACLTTCPWGRLGLLEGLKVRRAGPGPVRLAELELIVVGDALARVMLTAPLLP
jgi:hypothetical protein